MAAAQLKEERERDRRRRKLDGLAESEYYLLSSKHPAPIHRFSRMASAPSAPAPPLESASTFSSSFRDPPLQKGSIFSSSFRTSPSLWLPSTQNSFHRKRVTSVPSAPAPPLESASIFNSSFRTSPSLWRPSTEPERPSTKEDIFSFTCMSVWLAAASRFVVEFMARVTSQQSLRRKLKPPPILS